MYVFVWYVFVCVLYILVYMYVYIYTYMYICTYTYILTFIHRTALAAARGAGLARHATSASSRARTAESLPTTAANAFVRRGTRASTAAQILTSQ